MAEMMKCDNCEMTEPRARLLRWVFVSRMGDESLSFGQQMPGPWHFCSWDCVSIFASTQDD